MKHKYKYKIPVSTKDTLFERINFIFLSKLIAPLIFLLVAGILIVLIQWAVLTQRGDSFSINKPSPETYRVISQIRYDDMDAAKALQTMVAESVAGVMVRDLSAKTRLQRRLEAIRDLKDISARTLYLANFPEALLRAIMHLKNEDKARILNLALNVGNSYIDRLESEKVYRGNNALMSSILWEEIGKVSTSVSDANLVYQILIGLGNLNFKVDEDLTKLARQAAINDVPILDRRLEIGDVIINKGDTVTEQTAILLRLQGYTEDVFPYKEIFAVIIFVISLPLWLNILYHGAGEQKPTWWCVVFIILTAWISETVALRLGIYGAGTLAAVTISFLCIPDYLAFCLALLASCSGIFILVGQAVMYQILLAVLAIFSSTIGFYFLRNLESRRQVSRRIILTAIILMAIRMFLRQHIGVAYVQDDFRLFIPLGVFWKMLLKFTIFEVVMSHFMILVLQYFEEYLGVLSILSLREVSHPSSPLLRELQRNAPGTYQHCSTIATLIEAVGMKLNMDANLLRAGAYYHDIGKLRKPQYFVENQGGGVNTHDEMSPMLSSMTIRSHVQDGLDLAFEAKLPKRIRDFIAEHHGTTCTRYFYNKAVAMGENVEWASFCYPGPKPQTRETALLMIVDSVEAAVRAANIREIDDTFVTLEKIVNQVITSKINENQFDEVNFTLKDLALIKETLISVLMSMYHTRKVKKIERKK
ncbi:MAG: HDIG domain-containing protein [Synergistaceae bacterium]|nr:HDIG domain-containing protein [Synergistaceae bacterium]